MKEDPKEMGRGVQIMKDEMARLLAKWSIYQYTAQQVDVLRLVMDPIEAVDIEARFNLVAKKLWHAVKRGGRIMSNTTLLTELTFRQDPVLSPVMELIDEYEVAQIERFGDVFEELGVGWDETP